MKDRKIVADFLLKRITDHKTTVRFEKERVAEMRSSFWRFFLKGRIKKAETFISRTEREVIPAYEKAVGEMRKGNLFPAKKLIEKVAKRYAISMFATWGFFPPQGAGSRIAKALRAIRSITA